MERRRLGTNGPEITVLGIGTAPIGVRSAQRGTGSTGAPRTRTRRSRPSAPALDAGANWIDTAPFYGWGRAEEIVRRALDGRADDVLVFTKCGTVPRR